MIKLTPEHEARRKKKAGCYAIEDHKIIRSSEHDAFIAGMAAEHEVARLMGRIETLTEWIERLVEQCRLERGFPLSEHGEGGQSARIDLVSYLKQSKVETEAQLKALLEEK